MLSNKYHVLEGPLADKAESAGQPVFNVDIRQEPLPMSGAGKILKKELRAPYWEGKTRQVN